MKVLSVRQPWAHALLHLGKDVENRSWSTAYRGPVALHASRRVDPAGVRWAHQVGLDLRALPRGVILGAMTLHEVTREYVSPWAQPGAWHWVMRDRVPLLNPIPWSGVLKLVDIPPEVTALILADLARPR